ncbi:MAG: hypothetical protein K8R88_06400 [Armatimonadetes bacterium]|nr:hypothetical protein [Armatimonadota bacterium]
MNWIKSNRAELLLQAQKFSAGISAEGLTVGMTAPEISGFGTTLSAYSDNLTAVIDARTAYEQAYEAFMGDKTLIVKLMRKYNNRMQASSGITNAKRALIGLPIPAGSSSIVEPKTVTGLIATPFANGTVKLKWNRSGNASSVIFNIETSNDSVAWELLTTRTGVAITLSDFAPGETKYFRIVATRGPLSATPSDPVVIYSGSGGGQLSIAA